ncbi:hypothetical protein KVF89_22425 [Nocardioides carbamazepini]|uniref:hypothetical protein n=1 Tax=Nocardioides carbamazepini TaxID=2854259 RepID=UPI0021499D54|nr:hypothetical protein [Nocardioides carbamazepini]MCR1785313.1 hypothetical protein [Nocardioides carbamazepini]
MSTGWPSVRDKCVDLGIEFQAWQSDAGKVILAKRADGKYAATIGGVVISIPRQVGKTFLMGAIIFALCLLNPGMTVIWTAHRSRTAEETFKSMRSMSRRKKIRPHMLKPVLGSGEEEIRFRNGSRILFGARERGFGLGFAKVDVIVFDEAQRLTDRAIDDMIPTANQSQLSTGALIFYTGTPPRPEDAGEVFTRKRQDALSGEDEDTVYIEFSADDDADPNDWEQVSKANPSYPDFTPQESILRMRKNLGEESFLREGLGIWNVLGQTSVIDTITWHEDRDPASMAIERLSLGIQVSPDRSVTTVGLAGQRADGRWHVEVDEQRNGVDWAIEWVVDRCAKNNIRAVVVDGQSQAATLVDALKAHKVAVTVIGTREVAASAGTLVDKAVGIPAGVDADGNPVEAEPPTLRHLDQPLLNASNGAAGKHSVMGGKAWVWAAKHPGLDITPTQAVSLALWGAMNSNVKKPTRKRTGTGRRVVTG